MSKAEPIRLAYGTCTIFRIEDAALSVARTVCWLLFADQVAKRSRSVLCHHGGSAENSDRSETTSNKIVGTRDLLSGPDGDDEQLFDRISKETSCHKQFGIVQLQQ